MSATLWKRPHIATDSCKCWQLKQTQNITVTYPCLLHYDMFAYWHVVDRFRPVWCLVNMSKNGDVHDVIYMYVFICCHVMNFAQFCTLASHHLGAVEAEHMEPLSSKNERSTAIRQSLAEKMRSKAYSFQGSSYEFRGRQVSAMHRTGIHVLCVYAFSFL